MAEGDISQKVRMGFFEEESLDGTLSFLGVVDGKVVGVYSIDKLNSKVAWTDLEVFERGKGYARYFIKHMTDTARRMKVLHCVSFKNEDAKNKLMHILLEHHYSEMGAGTLGNNYSDMDITAMHCMP